MFKVKVLKDKKTATKIGEFLTGPAAFEQTWAPQEKRLVKQAPLESLKSKNHRYWYIEKKGEIIGAMGVRENKYGSGRFEMDSDYLAVHEDYRRQGLASLMLEKVKICQRQ
jgi:N-acetylglutamate synthase-like GNAT family acetyltransferase